jgi:hypothetical protein
MDVHVDVLEDELTLGGVERKKRDPCYARKRSVHLFEYWELMQSTAGLHPSLLKTRYGYTVWIGELLSSCTALEHQGYLKEAALTIEA